MCISINIIGDRIKEARKTTPLNESEIARRFINSKKKRLQKKAVGLTQDELADRLGVKDRISISKWENGIQIPSGENILKICESLDVDVAYLYGKQDEKRIDRNTKLSIEALDKIESLHNTSISISMISFLSRMIEHDEFWEFLEQSRQIILCKNASNTETDQLKKLQWSEKCNKSIRQAQNIHLNIIDSITINKNGVASFDVDTSQK